MNTLKQAAVGVPTRSQLIRALVAAALLALSVGAGSAQAQEPGTVTFRLTLRGNVDPSDSFTLAVNPDNGLIVSPGASCAPNAPAAEVEPCAPGDYEFTTGGEALPPGTDLHYVFGRVANGQPQRIYEGTITVMQAHHRRSRSRHGA